MSIRDWLLGPPLASNQGDAQQVGALKGVPILGLDALSSAAYGPEALLTVLLPLGTAGLAYITGLTACIVGLLAVVALSYRQTIEAYPSGGGAYTVAKENLGTRASLLAAAALGVDYLLNVAVAISAGVGALVSAVPHLLPYTLPLCLIVLVFLTIMNLRGVRATGNVFLVPTLLFVASLFGVVAIGAWKAWSSGGHPVPIEPPPRVPVTVATASAWLLLRSFASGCTAMTGVEAVSNGVPIFHDPATVRARRCLTTIVLILMGLLLGVAFMCRLFDVTATVPGQRGYQSVLSQITAATVGRGVFYYVTIASVITVLALSANTSFADFPRLYRLLALDRFLPEHFIHRGRRLTFSHGIYTLGLLSAVLLAIFHGITDALIPLFAVGAFAAFTLSQAGMVMHWRRTGSAPHRRRSMLLNGCGAALTGVTLAIMLVAKFRQGAWISLLLFGAIYVLMRRVRGHYALIERATATNTPWRIGPRHAPLAVVPIRRWNAVTQKALDFAAEFTDEVIAVQVLTDVDEVEDLTPRWDALVEQPARQYGVRAPKLVVLRSEYRHLFAPLVDFVQQSARHRAGRQVAVIVPELVELRWYHLLLHSQSAPVLRTLLLMQGGPQVVVVTTPWYLRDWMSERRRVLHPRRWFRLPLRALARQG